VAPLADTIGWAQLMNTRTANTVAAISGIVAVVSVSWLGISTRAASKAPLLPAEAVAAAPGGSSLSVEEAPTLGRPGARVWVVEFADFRCQYCRQFATSVLPAIKKKYIDTGLVRFAFMHAPAGPLRPLGVPSAEIAACAARQGKFWEVHDLLFGGDMPFDDQAVRKVAETAGVVNDSPNGLQACLKSGAGRLIVADMAAIAYDASVHATPTILVGYADGASRVSIVRRLSEKDVTGVSSAIDDLLKR
jgi:protein-disulfide isomerase